MTDDVGLEARYHVRRINDAAHKHDDCRYFVLDPQHDRLARAALRMYAIAAENEGLIALATDLRRWVDDVDRAPKVRTATGDWDPADPLPMQGIVARTEDRLRRGGWTNLANLLARWDERKLGR